MGADVDDKNGQEVLHEPQSEKENCDQDSDTLCGIGPFKPRWLQKWATPRTFLLIYSILGTLSGAYFTYRIGVISTLEKRFAFKSKTSGIIMTLDEVTIIVFGIPVGHFASKTHRPRMIGISMLLISLGCFLSAFPYFIYGPETHLKVSKVHNETKFELCDAEARMENCESDDDRPPTMAAVFFLIFAGLTNGFGNMTYHTIGLAYLDDNAKKKNTPLYLAIVFTLRMLGPLLGYVVSSFCLKYYENPLDDPGFDAQDPRWIGAWWVGFLFQGTFLFIFGSIIMLFPRRLPGHKKEEVVEKKKAKFKIDIAGLLSASKRLVTNPLFLALTAQTVLSDGTIGLFMMLPKYMENQFRLSASDANMYSGPPGIIALMSAILTGGFLMWKFKPSRKALTMGLVALEVIGCFGYLLLMIPTCENVKISNYGLQDNNFVLNGTCNANCNCSRSDFTPVCGSDGQTVFFSACYAGCTESSNKTFTNCACARDSGLGEDLEPLTEGFCRNDACWLQTLAYVIMLPIFKFIINLLRVAHMMVLFRSVSAKDKSLAIGAMEALLSVGLVPFLMLFTNAVDSLCLVWEESCGETGNCWFYDVQRFNYLLHGIAFVSTALSALCMLVIYIYRGRISDFYEEYEDNESTKQTPEENALAEF